MNKKLLTVTSLENKRVKDAIKLKDIKEQRKFGKVLIEGWNIVREALKNQLVKTIFCLPEMVERVNGADEIIVINESVAKKMSDVETPQNIFAIISLKSSTFQKDKNVLILENIQDPGNVGTLLRTAKAFGFDNVLLLPGTANPYHSKTVRAAQGVLFQLNLIFCNLKEAQELLKNHVVFATHLHKAAVSYNTITVKMPHALALGNEGKGISDELLTVLTPKNLIIPHEKSVESLNVALAGAIVMNYFYQFTNK